MTYLIALLIFFSIFGFCGGLLGLYEIVKLKYAGTLLCRGQPVNGTKIELREDDTEMPLDSDDLFDTVITNGDGYFLLQGEEREWDGLEPFLLIRHGCASRTVIGNWIRSANVGFIKCRTTGWTNYSTPNKQKIDTNRQFDTDIISAGQFDTCWGCYYITRVNTYVGNVRVTEKMDFEIKLDAVPRGTTSRIESCNGEPIAGWPYNANEGEGSQITAVAGFLDDS